MALISLSSLEKSFGPRTVLKALSLSLERGDRLGLIGRNGCGKTTLLNIINQREEPDRGEMHVARGLRIAWLDQNPRLEPERTVWDEARTALADLYELERRLENWRHTIADAPNHELSPADHEAYARDEGEFATLRGHDRERHLEIALQKLGLDALRDRPCGQLSGGERTRLALARFLVSPFDVLILDEPTNHLDIQAIEWLQDALKEMAQTFIIVSHDRAFLDAVAMKTAELDDGKLTVITGNYTQFMTVKAERMMALQREADLESRFIAKEMDFIRRHINSQRTREAKGRLKRLERRETIEVPIEQKTVQLKFKGGKTHADVVLSASEVAVKRGERTLFEDLSFELYCGEKIGIVGANGAGKTTLSLALLGQLPLSAGRLRLAPQLKVGTFTQDLSFLREDRTVLEEYARLASPPNLNAARAPLGAYLFSGKRIEQRVGSLSGGEKARLALCILVAKDNDVLLLDEPTNHLDIPSRQALEESLETYPGTCLIISHDRRFLDRVTQRTIWIDGARTKVYLGAYTDARELRDAETFPESAVRTQPEKQSSTPVLPRQKKINEYKLAAIEKEIIELEERKEILGESLYDEAVFRNAVKVREVSAELDEIEKRLLQLNEEWEAVIDAAG